MKDQNPRETVTELWRKSLGLETLDQLGVKATCVAGADRRAAQMAATLASAGPAAGSIQDDTLDANEAPMMSHAALAPLTQAVTARVTFPRVIIDSGASPTSGDSATLPSGGEAAPASGVSATLPSEGVPVPAHRPAPSPEVLADGSPPHYRILREIGRGGMGVVYRAEQRSLNREVALKMVSPDLKGASRSKFQGEAIVTGCLDHPNIVPVHELIESEAGDSAFVMKLIEGRAWSELFDDGASFDEHIGIMLNVCNAIEYAHDKGLAHLDLKPDNVMVGAFGEVLVMDWGLAVDIRDTPSYAGVAVHKSQVDAPCGTPCYIAPELAMGWGDQIDTWTDVYLLGAVLYEVLTGKPLHPGETVEDALDHSVSGVPPEFDEAVPEALQQICRQAVAHSPLERTQTVTAFREALEAYLHHRESLVLTRNAYEILEQIQASSGQGGAAQEARYTGLNDALASFRQAALLWEGNAEARLGELQTQEAFAEEALRNRDLGVARAHAVVLPEDHEGRGALLARIDAALLSRARRRRTTRWIKRSLGTAIVLIIAGLIIAYVAIEQERQKAVVSSGLAEERLQKVRQLSHGDRVDALREEADRLWPALPAVAPSMAEWLVEARELLGHLGEHRAWLETLRIQGRLVDDRWVFDRPEVQWEHDTLAEMLSEMDTLEAKGIPEMAHRRGLATTIEGLSLITPKGAWDEAIDAVKRSPHYGGLVLSPQLGLVPIGADPKTGFQEFVHVQSGTQPTRDAKGQLVLTEGTGVVLVLVPGGAFPMGAERPSEARPIGSPNVDPDARESEGPVHSVTLSPFFLGKHELSQSQWLRFAASNPAAYVPGTSFGGRDVTLRHPVEQVRWREAKTLLHQMDLQLPTEAQWEYGMRGGTSTVYPTGDALESLRGSLNIADSYCRSHEGPGSWQYETWLDDGYTVHAPVGTYRANGFGLHDMAGNVWEWVADRYGDYTLPVRPGDGLRQVSADAPGVFRGGGFRANKSHARAADRYSLYAHDFRAYDVGLRAARRVDP